MNRNRTTRKRVAHLPTDWVSLTSGWSTCQEDTIRSSVFPGACGERHGREQEQQKEKTTHRQQPEYLWLRKILAGCQTKERNLNAEKRRFGYFFAKKSFISERPGACHREESEAGALPFPTIRDTAFCPARQNFSPLQPKYRVIPNDSG